jgi:hypothetical protein
MLPKRQGKGKCGTDPKSFYTLITLPAHLRGYVKYVVVLLPLNGCTYSLGIKYVCQSEGARELLQRLDEQRDRKHKKPLHAFLCASAASGTICPQGWGCTEIHCTIEGFRAKRTWDRPVKAIRSLRPPVENESQGSQSNNSTPRDRSDQGTEEALTDDSMVFEDFEAFINHEEGTDFAAPLSPIPMTLDQFNMGHTAHNPYAPQMPSKAHPIIRRPASLDLELPGNSHRPVRPHVFCSPPTPFDTTPKVRVGPPGSPPCAFFGCTCSCVPPWMTSIGQGAVVWRCSPPVLLAGHTSHLGEVPTPPPKMSPHPGSPPVDNWSRVDQTALKQSLQRVREKVKRSYSLTSEYSVTSEYSLSSGYSGPSLSARTISDFKFPAARQDRPLVPLNNLDAMSTPCSRSSSRSWADDVDENCPMDFSSPIPHATP